MTDIIRRNGKVTLTATGPANSPRITGRVDAADLIDETVEALAALWSEQPQALTRGLGDVLHHRAEMQEAVGRNAAEERYHRGRLRDVIDELLSAADVPPDPSVAIGADTVRFIADTHNQLCAEAVVAVVVGHGSAA